MVIITRARQTWDSWAWDGGWQGDFYPYLACDTKEGAEKLLNVKFDEQGKAVIKTGDDTQVVYQTCEIIHYEV